MYDQKKMEAALLKLMREHGGTLTVDPATQVAQAVTLERLAAAGTVELVSRSPAGTSTYCLRKHQLQFHRGQAVTGAGWEPHPGNRRARNSETHRNYVPQCPWRDRATPGAPGGIVKLLASLDAELCSRTMRKIRLSAAGLRSQLEAGYL